MGSGTYPRYHRVSQQKHLPHAHQAMPLLGQTARQDQEKLMQSQEKKRPTSNQKAPKMLEILPPGQKEETRGQDRQPSYPNQCLLLHKARPTRKKKADTQSRTLDPARTASELCTKFSAIQSFPSTPSRKSFKTLSPKWTSSRKSAPGLPQPQFKPPYTSPPLLSPQDSTSYHPASSD